MNKMIKNNDILIFLSHLDEGNAPCIVSFGYSAFCGNN